MIDPRKIIKSNGKDQREESTTLSVSRQKGRKVLYKGQLGKHRCHSASDQEDYKLKSQSSPNNNQKKKKLSMAAA